ncbi:MAG: pilus assembly protein PilM [Persicimonas sp.]
MANHIIGLDFGTYSIKLVRMERGREPRVIGFDEEPIPRMEQASPEQAAIEEESAEGTEPARTQPGGDFEDAPTQVRSRDELDGQPDGGAPVSADGEPVPAGPDDPSEDDDGGEESSGWESALERLIDRGAFAEDGIVVTFLPNGQAMSVHHQVPFADRAKVQNILPHMLDDRLPIDADQVLYDFQLIDSTVEDGAEAVIGFARKEQIGEFLSELKTHQIDPAVLGIPELLLTYGLEQCAPTDTGTYAVVDIGHEYTRVLVVHQREPAVARSVRFGGRELTEAIVERYDASWEQAENLKVNHGAILGPDDAPTDNQRVLSDCLEGAFKPFVRDLRRTFQSLYARSRIQIDEVFLCGGTGKLTNLPDYLSRELGVPVAEFPIENLPGFTTATAGLARDHQQLALAASSAFQQISGRDEERLIDLRKGEFTYRGKSSFLRSQMLKYGAAAAVLFVLIVAMLFTQKIELESQRDSMRDALVQRTTQLFGEPVFTNDEITKRLTGDESTKAGFIPKMSAYELYYELSSHIPQDVEMTVTRFEVDVDRNITQIYGQTTSAQSVEKLMDGLRELDCLEDVRQEGELRIQSDSEVDFHLHVSSECS